MKLEVLLSCMNLDKKNLDKMNITSKCTVINQCDKNKKDEVYKNFYIYNYNEKGVSNSRNRGLEHVSEDIILFCDDDVVYDSDYENKVIKEFENNPKADVIIFNFDSPNRRKKKIKKRKKLHIYNSFRYATYDIAIRRTSIKNIRFSKDFGPGAKYNNGSDTIFIKDLYKNKLKVYSSPIKLGVAYNEKSTWFKGYNEKYFFNKGALYTGVSRRYRHILMLQYILRHKEVLTDINFKEAYKLMLKGSKDYRLYKKNSKKKILHIIDSKGYGGIEKVVVDLSSNINNYEFDYLNSSKLYGNRVNYYDLDIVRNSFINKIKYNHRLYKFLKQNKYEYRIVHIHSGVFLYSFQVAIIAKLAGIKKVIVHSHNTINMGIIKRTFKRILNPLYRKITNVHLTCSKKAMKSLYTKFKDVILIKNGININDYKFNNEIRNKYIKELKISNKKVYGHIGSFTDRKNHSFLIDIFNEIQKKEKNAVLLLIGTGELEDGIKKKVKKLKIENKILFLGFRNDVKDLLNCIDVFIFPSIREGLSLAVVEALTSGMLVFASTATDKEEFKSEKLFVIDSNDINDWVNTILSEKIKDRKNDYKIMLEDGYDIKESSKELEKIYDKLQ